MKRPILNPIPLSEAMPAKPGTAYITMSVGQWDSWLEESYQDGWILLELDDNEKPVRAYRRMPS
jgi:hypothetical protein